MGLFDFLHRPSEKNTQEAIKEVKKMPTMMSIYREDGTQTEVLNIEEAQKFRHSNGSISSLISAKVIHVNKGIQSIWMPQIQFVLKFQKEGMI